MQFRNTIATGLALALAVLATAGLAAPAAEAAPANKVDINSASVEELTTLPGVGETLAARIVEYREENGPFKDAAELMNVKGIGERSFKKLEPHVSVGPSAARGGAGR
jgi:competence protein ComEA